MPDYLSTDPNADDESAGYLSTDPNAGEESASKPASKSATPAILAGVGAAKSAPAIVSGVNKVARGTAALDPVVTSIVGSALPVPGGAAVGAAAPKVAGIIAKATDPRTAAVRGIAGQFTRGAKAAGPIARGAGWLSRAATTASLPLTILSSLYDSLQYGQGQAAKLDDPSLSPEERDELLRQLHSAGGF
jgi:hypothetical protein